MFSVVPASDMESQDTRDGGIWVDIRWDRCEQGEVITEGILDKSGPTELGKNGRSRICRPKIE